MNIPLFKNKKKALYAGVYLTADNLRAVLLSGSSNNLILKDLATIPLSGVNMLEAVKEGLKQLNAKIKLRHTQVYLALSDDHIFSKFFLLPALSDDQLQQAVEYQMKPDKKWDPGTCRLSFDSVGMVGSQTRVFAAYMPQNLVTSLLSLFATVEAQVYVIEPDLTALHKAILASKIFADIEVVAVVNAEAKKGRLTIFTKNGVMLSRRVGRLRAGMADEEEGEGEGAASSIKDKTDALPLLEEFHLDVAINELIKTFDYYEYSLTAEKIDAIVLMGDPGLAIPLGKRIVDEVGVDIKPLVMKSINLGKAAAGFDPLIYAVSVGTALTDLQ
ncbi:pilus assembly protein PilM [candidate division NPL-UPA2 bacterium]|nr:pilus assembly protein PilM [candidate division NPL-UPA2 bacterium]